MTEYSDEWCSQTVAGWVVCAGGTGEFSPGRVEIQVQESREAAAGGGHGDGGGGLQLRLAHRRPGGVAQLRAQPKSNAAALRDGRVAHPRDIWHEKFQHWYQLI